MELGGRERLAARLARIDNPLHQRFGILVKADLVDGAAPILEHLRLERDVCDPEFFSFEIFRMGDVLGGDQHAGQTDKLIVQDLEVRVVCD